jgi:tRNA splicing ligase
MLEKKKNYEALQHFQIPNKLIRLVKATMDNTVAKVQVQKEMIELFEIRDDLKQGDDLAPLLFRHVMEYVMRKVTVERNITV